MEALKQTLKIPKDHELRIKIPQNIPENESEKPKDIRELGIIWAKESMEKIRNELLKEYEW